MSTASRSRRPLPAQRPWTQHRSGVTPQLRRLIEDAGGQAAFARRVWGKGAVTEHKGKVAKWYYGRSGISLPEAREVAAKMDTSVAFILGVGEAIPRWSAGDSFAASARQLLTERAEQLETLRRFADKAGDDGLADYTIEGDIVGKVERLALAWVSEIHTRVREVVDGEINARIAYHQSKGRAPGPASRRRHSKRAGRAGTALRRRGR